MTTIDPRKVNLAEKDIEDWIYMNDEEAIPLNWGPDTYVKEWIARQYHVPSGIIDLLGITNDGDFVVVEVKNTEITSEALAQVCRYAYDIRMAMMHVLGSEDATVFKIVIGKGSPETKIMFEARALDVSLYTFEVALNLKVSGEWSFRRETDEKFHQDYQRIGSDPMFDRVRQSSDIQDVINEARRVIGEEDGDER